MSQAIIIVGAPGCGKTYFTKHTLLAPVHRDALYIFDTNKEYGDIYPYPFKPNVELFLSRIYNMETDEFLMKNAVVLIEDATSFFSNRGFDIVMQRIIVGRRHPNITLILLFHSLRDVPKYIVNKCNLMFIFKTVDSEKYVRSEYDGPIFDTWNDVQTRAQSNPFYSSKPPPPGTVPDYGAVTLY